MSAAWFRCRLPRPRSRLRLICLPHAGGSAAFFAGLDTGDDIEVHAVEYPGRGHRTAEPCIDSMERLAPAIAGAIRTAADRPVALFGHSMGAAVAYEVARLLTEWGSAPVHLFASGRHAPTEVVPGDVHRLDDEGLVADLVRLGGADPELFASPELRDFFLPPIRSDYRLAETYRRRPGGEPACPITVLHGDADPDVTPEQAGRWAEHATVGFARHEFPGDHFYLVPHRRAVQAVVRSALRGVAVA